MTVKFYSMDNNQNIVLGIDTTQAELALAFVQGEQVLATKVYTTDLPHSQRLFVCLHEVLQDLALSPTQIDLIAVNTGPGSFTGLRVGIAAAQGLASTLQKPLIGINAIDALSLATHISERLIAVLINASRGEVYLGSRMIDGDSGIIQIQNDVVVRSEDLKTIVSARLAGKRAIFLGNGAQKHWQILSEPNEQWDLMTTSLELTVVALAQHAATLENSDYQNKPATAYYLRPSEAEMKFKA